MPEENLVIPSNKLIYKILYFFDTIALDTGRAIAAIWTMRLRLKRPEKTAELLLLDMEAAGLTETVDVLRPHVGSL